MNYEAINTERLTFEDELTKRDACPVCQLASDSEALQYLQRLDLALQSVHAQQKRRSAFLEEQLAAAEDLAAGMRGISQCLLATPRRGARAGPVPAHAHHSGCPS